ncbi:MULTISPECIES: SDR family NAD(P)-dependent oxidoreductase [Catenuloplanes]|uniref:NAD(P)-dependent dehydrogenase (Short-subunit alcohol dehydrogenase family) n=1 Tax=Catenuloplanes niger TaxID=587534 RepID=A0AAE3ZKY2_9ACTN|nr:SDR family NAD(P)-dependent oxidoreductase [Catenuloplanes niger]MDR7320807.1 NAD(P)-dependent dehydrogenase (short-subunit alcohol dehydrogenase family) [Catenuloplanes niger]
MRLDDKTVVLTGATSGIGEAAARLLAPSVRTLVIQGPEPASDVAPLIKELGGETDVHYVRADFTSFAQVRRAGTEIRAAVPAIDVLVNNAGVPGAGRRRVTTDGNERTLQVNYLALTLLTQRLLPAIHRGGRIVNVSSTTHRMTGLALDDLNLTDGYDAVRAYAQSKLAILSYSLRLAGELAGRGVDVVTISPGVISTGLLHAMFGGGGVRVEHGGRRVIEAITAEVPTGTYIDDGEIVAPSDEARDPSVAAALAARTTSLIRH